jgi:hypothetical protein
MFKQKSLLTLAVLTALILMSGCSQSDGNSTSDMGQLENGSTEVAEENSTQESSLDVDETEVSAEDNVTQTSEVMYGHTLPPEPDPDINNATLLGVDSNDNGVRDDVERWIYKRYNTHIPCKMVEVNVTIPASGETVTGYDEVCEEKEVPYHQIVREIAMQGARAAQIIIQEPEKARETMKYLNAAADCASYFQLWAEFRNEPLLFDTKIEKDYSIVGQEFDNIQFNTTMRTRAYAKYNMALSGGVYGSPSIDGRRNACDFNVTKLLEQ